MIISRDSKGHCWVLMHSNHLRGTVPPSTWTHQHLLETRLNSCIASCCGRIPSKLLHQTEEAVLENFPKIWIGKKSCLEKTPHCHYWHIRSSNRASLRGIILFPFCSAVALPKLPTEGREGKIRGRSNIFCGNILISCSICNAWEIFLLIHLQPF